MQLNLLNSEDDEPEIHISGLTYIRDFISAQEQALLLSQIDRQPWLTDLKRRVQHYGYKYDYKARTVGNDAYLGALPDWLSLLSKKLHDDAVFQSVPDQVIVNEYLPGQGISAHIDCVPCFADTIASLSLGSSCVMEFSNPKTGEKKSIVLEERSLIILSGSARYEWQHAIPARKSDIINGVKTERARRVSLTRLHDKWPLQNKESGRANNHIEACSGADSGSYFPQGKFYTSGFILSG